MTEGGSSTTIGLSSGELKIRKVQMTKRHHQNEKRSSILAAVLLCLSALNWEFEGGSICCGSFGTLIKTKSDVIDSGIYKTFVLTFIDMKEGKLKLSYWSRRRPLS